MKHRASIETHVPSGTHCKQLCMCCQLYSYIDVVDGVDDSADVSTKLTLIPSVQIRISLTSVKDIFNY